jgi:hypothetical protein
MHTSLVAALLAVMAIGGWVAVYLVRSRRGATEADGKRDRRAKAATALAEVDRALTTVDEGQGSSASATVKAWAEERRCVFCHGPLVESRVAGHHIALLEPGGITREWVDIASDRLPLALATCLPVCWNCHVAATFRRLHPELVTDRDERVMHVERQR